MGLEFFRGVDITRKLAPDFLACLDLAQKLVSPVFANMAIGAERARNVAVRLVYGLLVFLNNVIVNLMAANTEHQPVHRFYPGIGSARNISRPAASEKSTYA